MNFRRVLFTVFIFSCLFSLNSWAKPPQGEDETASYNQQIQQYLKKQSPLPTDKQEKVLTSQDGAYEALIMTRKAENEGDLSYLFFRNKKNGTTYLLEACPAFRSIENLAWKTATQLRFSCSMNPQITYDHVFDVQSLRFISVQSKRD